METMNQAIQVGSEEVEVVAVAVEEVDGQVGEVEDMAMVAMMLLTLWLCRVIRWDLITNIQGPPCMALIISSYFYHVVHLGI